MTKLLRELTLNRDLPIADRARTQIKIIEVGEAFRDPYIIIEHNGIRYKIAKPYSREWNKVGINKGDIFTIVFERFKNDKDAPSARLAYIARGTE